MSSLAQKLHGASNNSHPELDNRPLGSVAPGLLYPHFFFSVSSSSVTSA